MRAYEPFYRCSKLIAIVAGGSSAALGLVVLAGWYTHHATLVQVASTLAPMHYNAALSFLLCGLGLLALTLGWFRLAAACGAVAGMVGFVTLGEDLFGISLGLDQLFMRAYITVRTSYP